MTQALKIIKHDGVATVTLNRPEKHNAFDDDLIRQMTEAFIDIDADDSIRVMVLASTGKNFSAGADLAWMKRMVSYSYEENLRDAHALALMLKSLNNLSKPSIARVHGAAFGGAVGLVSCCDIAIASSSARFCLSEVRIGLIPATISPYVIAAIGSRTAKRLFITAESFCAEQALAFNLISAIYEEEQLDERIAELTETIIANSPAAVIAAKQLAHDMDGVCIDDDLIKDTSKRIAQIRTSNEGQEGLAAFLAKRSPCWTKTS